MLRFMYSPPPPHGIMWFDQSRWSYYSKGYSLSSNFYFLGFSAFSLIYMHVNMKCLGLQVQEIQLTTSLDQEGIKKALQRVLERVPWSIYSSIILNHPLVVVSFCTEVIRDIKHFCPIKLYIRLIYVNCSLIFLFVSLCLLTIFFNIKKKELSTSY